MSLLLLQSYEAQNLVPNGSFEEFQECPDGVPSDFGVSDWVASRYSFDNFSSCAEEWVGVPSNLWGFQEAKDGESYVGLTAYRPSSDDDREHIAVELMSSLEIGTTYYFSMWCSASEYWGVASNGLGFMVTRTPYFHDFDGFEFNGNPSPVDRPTYSESQVLADTMAWTQVKSSFVADSAYEFLVVGAFVEQEETDTIHLNSGSVNNTAYYFIDDVRLSSDSTFAYGDIVSIYDETEPSSLRIWPNPTMGEIYISASLQITNLLVYSLRGELLFEEAPKRDSYSLDISELAVGVYQLIVIDSEGRRQSIRVLKSF